MLHVIRLNVHGIGYSCFAGEGSRFAEIPLGSTPAELDEAGGASYRAVQQRLDAFLAVPGRPWGMAFARLRPGGRIAVGYGGRLDVRDDHGREGVKFTHSLLLGSAETLSEATMGVLVVLSGSRFPLLAGGLADVVAGRRQPDDLVGWVAGQVASAITPGSVRFAEEGYDGPLVGAVRHDVAGAAPLAWLVLARQQQRMPAPWEVYDAAGTEGSLVVTASSVPGGEAVDASVLMARTAHAAEVRPGAAEPGGRAWKVCLPLLLLAAFAGAIILASVERGTFAGLLPEGGGAAGVAGSTTRPAGVGDPKRLQASAKEAERLRRDLDEARRALREAERRLSLVRDTLRSMRAARAQIAP